MQYTQLFRKLREQKGLSHEALAALARCHRNTVLNVEGGRQVKFKTMARLMGKMGYAADSSEMTSLALLWLEATSGIRLSEPATLATARRKVSTYARTTNQALTQLTETIRQAGLDEEEIRLLTFAAKHGEMLGIIESIRDLLSSSAESSAELKVAEDK
ncbi:MAG: helix-turn-helix transcriptional regulator [Opitutaceae bacterium]|nr:helix-turn-helix transcriptional regulator [Opitutaceae bacterium]